MDKSQGFDFNKSRTLLVKHVMEVFEVFKSSHDVPEEYYSINRKLAVLAVTNALSDIKRSSDYHSTTGPSDWKIAGFIGKWTATQKPIQFQDTYPINQTNEKLLQINSEFSAFLTQSLVDEKMYTKLYDDLKYCFEFRNMDGDAICLLLSHSLSHAKKAYKSK